MAPISSDSSQICHIVALPYPGRGHVNPMMVFCKQLVLLHEPARNIQLTIVVTEEWLGLIGSKQKPANVHFVSIPNVLPSELVRGADHAGFLEAVSKKMEQPVEQVLDGLDSLADVIIADSFLPWAVDVGSRRKIPVASFWPASASSFSAFYHHDLLTSHQHYPIDLLGEKGELRINYIPGIPSIRLADLSDCYYSYKKRVLNVIIEVMSSAFRAQYIIFRTLPELEEQVLDALKMTLPKIPIYPIGPALTFPDLKNAPDSANNCLHEPEYIQWLNSQHHSSVLFVSLGSYLSTSRVQMEELAAGLCNSNVPFLWVAREETSFLKSLCGERGLIIDWCDQTKVLYHKSTAGFLTHCGWNSALETAFAGIPVLTFPLSAEQPLNSKIMVEDWKIGWRLKDKVEKDGLVKREKIAALVRDFMNLDSSERKRLDKSCKVLQQMLCTAIAQDRTSESNNICTFITEISRSCNF